MNYYKGLEEIGRTGDFDKIPDELLHDYISDFTLEFNSRSLVKKLNIDVVLGRIEHLCECEAHTFYEWEKLENKCTDCGKKIY